MQEGGDRGNRPPPFYSFTLLPRSLWPRGEETYLTTGSSADHESVRLMIFTVPSGFTVSRWSVPSLQVARHAGCP